jgi:hypothetical protein
MICLFEVPNAYSQIYTASVTGTVRDSSGAVVPNANLALLNTATGVSKNTETNGAGVFIFTSIQPGNYTLEASKTGFETNKIASFTLVVDQNLIQDFTLQVGAETQTVTVEATATVLQTATSDLSTLQSNKGVESLPLNGRNFTQLLTLSPGASPVNVSQQAYGVFAPISAQSTVSFPAMNGQPNRSNFFYLDGINDSGPFASMYAVPPILDSIQEFKMQSHNDDVEFGGSMGGVINVVSKSGTNDFHGDAWEYVRNNAFDARNTFQSKVTPLHYNMFGGTVGGPVILPHFNGREKKTFFFLGYQGFRYSKPANGYYTVPTAAELSGDFSAWPQQIYNPFTTAEDPKNPGSYIRQPFVGNIIPANLLNPGMVYYAQHTLPTPINTGVGTFNAENNVPTTQSEEDYTARVDQSFGSKDTVMFRVSGLTQDTTSTQGTQNLPNLGHTGNKNWGISYVHTFGPSTVLQVQFGRSQGAENQTYRFAKGIDTAGIIQAVGWSQQTVTYQSGSTLVPALNVTGFFGGGEGNNLNPNITDVWQYRANVTHTTGRHQFQWGGELASNGFEGVYETPSITFNPDQTANPENLANTGLSLASFFLGLPGQVWQRNVHETTRWGGTAGFYFMDRYKATRNLTVNIGLRWDRKWQPPYGKWDTVGKPGGIETGEFDINPGEGVYILQVAPPTCAVRGHAPCLPDPTGALPPHTILSPHPWIYHNENHDFQPRLGLAYRLNDKTVLRGGFGIIFEEWADVTQQSQNMEGNWPDTSNIQLYNQNMPNTTPGVILPNLFVNNPWPNLLPASSPFSPTGGSPGLDPNAENEYSMQWNAGVQREIAQDTTVSLSYVGSGNRHGRIGGFYNTALTPGPGPVQPRQLFPYGSPGFYQRAWNKSDYNSFQFQLNRRFHNGLTFTANYTWSKSMDYGCSGYENPEGCNVQDPYNWERERAVSGFDLPHIFTAHWLYELPFGRGKAFHTGNNVADYIIGGWQINGILTLLSGTPYTLNIPGDGANIGNLNTWRPNLVGNPVLPNPTPQEWFNTAAFAVPAQYTFGTLGRNTLRTDWYRNLDFSIFKILPVTESKQFEFRAESFNLFNGVVYGYPAGASGGAAIWLSAISPKDPNFGKVFSTGNSPRIIQLAVKFRF